MESKFNVVISGVSGRFPECDDIDSFKTRLLNRENLITVNDKTWPTDYKYGYGNPKIPAATGKYIRGLDFDLRVFKIHPLYASSIPGPSRKILEPAFEAIADAGLNPYSLDGRNIGVYASAGIFESDRCMFNRKEKTPFSLIVGSARAMLANRISFTFNLNGPSVTFNPDVMGDIQALKVAYDAIANGTIEGAIVVASSQVLDPKLSIQYIGLNLLSPDGVNRIFDKNGNGFTRSESCVAFYLQRFEDAKRNYGTIEVCEAVYPGSYRTLFVQHDKKAVTDFLSKIYDNDQLKNIALMELSSCGVEARDKSEIEAITEVICKNRINPLLIGSVVSNVGHTEISAPYIALLKALFSLNDGKIIPNINYLEPNYEIEALKNKSVQVVDEISDLYGDRIALNVLGLTGCLGHVVVKRNSREQEKSEEIVSFPRLLLICGRSKEDLTNMIEKIESMPYNEEFIHLTNDVFTPFMAYHLHRGYTILPKATKPIHEVTERGDSLRPIWFVFSGMGSHWNGMGKELLNLPVFSEAISKCGNVLKPKGIDLYHLLTSDDPTIFDDITNSFVSIISVQIAFVEVLRVLNIHPDGIIGHSAGECGCAYADGCLTLEEAVLAAYERGRASVETKTIRGMMAAIGRNYDYIKNIVPATIEVACHNSNSNCTISGPTDDVLKFVEKLKGEGIFTKAVNVSNIAYHSKYIADIGPLLLSKLQKVIKNPKRRSYKWICSSVPEDDWHKELAHTCSAEYFTNNLLNYVYFEEACKHIPSEAVLIEIAPHGLLQAILKRAFPHETITHIPLSRKSILKDNLNFLYRAIGRLYIAGYEPQVNALYPKIKYPVARSTPPISPLCTWLREEDGDLSHLNYSKDEPLSSFKIPLKIYEGSEFRYLKEHRIQGHIVTPFGLYLFLVWRAFSILRKQEFGSKSIVFQDLKLHKYVKLSIKKVENVSVLIQASGTFELVLWKNENDFEVLLTGIIETAQQDEPNFLRENIEKTLSKNRTALDNEKIYETFRNAGYDLGEEFRLIRTGILEHNKLQGEIQWAGNWITFLDSILKFHSLAKIRKDFRCYCPIKIRYLAISNKLQTTLNNNPVVECHFDFQVKELSSDCFILRDVEYDVFPRTTKTSSIDRAISQISFPLSKKTTFEFKSESVFLQYHRIPNDLEIENEENYQVGVEFTGTDRTGSRIMGLATISGNNFENDSELTWKIPKNWNLSKAAALPLAYVRAHYLSQILPAYKQVLSMFINMGEEIYFTRACVSLFTSRGLTMFVSVTNETTRYWANENFGNMKLVQMVDQENYKYEQEILMATKGVGVNVVVNCVKGIQHMTACMNVLSTNSLYLELGKQNCQDTEQLGLYSFVKSVTLQILPSSINDYIQTPKKTKKILKTSIEQSILKGSITPFNDECEPHNKIQKYTSSAKDSFSLQINKKRTFIIIGASKDRTFIRTMLWLIKEGASNFLLALTDNSTKSHLAQIFEDELSKKVTKLILLPPGTKLNSKYASQLVTEAQNIAPIEAVFVISTESKFVNLMNCALQKQRSFAYLISLFSNGLEFCEKRKNSGYPALVIEGNNLKDDIFYVLDRLKPLLWRGNNNDLPTVLKLQNTEQISRTENLMNESTLLEYIPKNIEILENMGQNTAKNLEFKEMCSMAPRYAETKNVKPVFFIPSIHETHLNELISKIMYPTFCATISRCLNSIEEMTIQLYKHLTNIQPSGSVTLVAETWNSVLGIELSLLLRKNNRPCKLILIEGVPEMWIKLAKNVPVVSLLNFANNLIKKPYIDHQILPSDYYIYESQKDNVDTVITNIGMQLTILNNYIQRDLIFQDTIIITTRIPEEWDLKLSVTSDIIEIGGNYYDEFITNPIIANVINKNAAFSWWNS